MKIQHNITGMLITIGTKSWQKIRYGFFKTFFKTVGPQPKFDLCGKSLYRFSDALLVNRIKQNQSFGKAIKVACLISLILGLQKSCLHVNRSEFHQEFNGHGPGHVTRGRHVSRTFFLIWKGNKGCMSNFFDI